MFQCCRQSRFPAILVGGCWADKAIRPPRRSEPVARLHTTAMLPQNVSVVIAHNEPTESCIPACPLLLRLPAMTHVLTAAARRAVQASQATEGSTDTMLAALFCELVSEEGRAHSRLQAAGRDPAHVLDAFRATFDLPPTLQEEQSKSSSGTTASHSAPAALTSFVIEAANHARLQDQTNEVTSEHLFLALCTFDSPIRDWLTKQGITKAVLPPEPSPPRSVVMAPPLHADVAIEWQAAPISDTTSAFRIIDAASNRVREALRTIEDFVRFERNDSTLTRELKEFRHTLTAALALLPTRALITARDVTGDVGTAISIVSERERYGLRHVVTAACKRLQEALRTVEEYGKLINGEFAQRIESLRYRSYTLEKMLSLEIDSRSRLQDALLYLLVSENTCLKGIGPTLHAALQGGVKIVQLREKQMADRELLDLARRVRRLTREYDAIFIMNDRPDLAVLAEADGVHVGQDELSVADARKIVGSDLLIGVSTHSIEETRQAVLDGADYLGVGPTFPSRTKSFSDFTGLDLIQQVAGEIGLPWYAIGGIDQSNLPRVLEAGAQRIAVSAAICTDDEPAAAAFELLTRLRTNSPHGGDIPEE